MMFYGKLLHLKWNKDFNDTLAYFCDFLLFQFWSVCDYLKMPTDYRHTDNHLRLVFVVVKYMSNGSGVRALTDGQTDGWTLPNTLSPCFAKLRS